MDFFEAQARAKRRTNRLVVLFALAVLGTIAASYTAALAILRYTGVPRPDENHYGYSRFDDPDQWWHADVFTAVALATVAIVGLASLYKWSQMRHGGSAVAELVGGRRVDPHTTNLHERRLLNVVEEMAIASGVPVPAVYVLDQEPAINAFAAGLTTSDAVVAVTRGTLEKLTRDELQGVVGHEFSHILNGDMRLNVKLAAIVFGILVIGLLGRGILEGLGRGRVRSGGKKGGGLAVILAIGVALLIIGYVGYFFGRLIQAAVSRQREFLADASAVQFTRNPSGLTGALKKIGGYALGSTVTDKHASEIGHFFFAQGFRSFFGGLWATHPPLGERLRAIDPRWDGKLFDPPEVVDVSRESFASAGLAGRNAAPSSAGFQPASPAAPPRTREIVREGAPAAPARIPFTPAVVTASIGALTEDHFRQARALLDSIPAGLRDGTRASATAIPLVYGLLISGAPAHRERQLALVAQHSGAADRTATQTLLPLLADIDEAAKLPFFQLCLPALRTLDPATLNRFVTTLDELVHADAEVTAFEFALQKMLLRQLALARANTPRTSVQFHSFQPLAADIAVVLSALARAGSTDPARLSLAFAAGVGQLPLIASRLALAGVDACSLGKLDTALDRLAGAALPIKQRVLAAAAHVIGSDQVVTPREADLYRAIAAAIDCPVPVLA